MNKKIDRLGALPGAGMERHPPVQNTDLPQRIKEQVKAGRVSVQRRSIKKTNVSFDEQVLTLARIEAAKIGVPVSHIIGDMLIAWLISRGAGSEELGSLKHNVL